mmetsp:Transcript_7097/g.17313  ORF Transcript_7097/g.17313 Transcript_7097/m.17313 type:complete len:430 (-) Transcript_7097:80-1369(-)
MAKKNRKEKKSQSERKAKKEEEAITWDDIAAMSDSDDEGGTGNGIELNTKAKTLQQSITKNIGSMLAMFKKTEAADEEEFEEDVLDGSSSEEGDEDDAEVEVEDDADLEEEEEVRSGDEEDKEGDDEEKTASFIDKIKNKSAVDEDGDSDSDSDSDEEDEEAKKKSEQYTKLANNNIMNSKALSVVATELNSVHSKMPWAETFVIVPATPLPFGENGDPESNPLDIHDDLKREVAFYNSALEAVNEARPKLEEANIPFTRPDDFFAEMIKTDDHMANVKDRLIFENKKIEAVAQRKSNKEQKLRAKESHANRLAEKSKRKRDHFQELDDWASSAAKNRGGALRDDVDDYFLNNRYNGTGPGKKRMNADKKFGFGGKNGRFKQNDRKSMNDMSGFNPRGNFAGGMKKTSKNGSGANRSGKRARDARRSRS